MPDFGSNLRIHLNQLVDAVLHRLGTRPSSPVEGQVWYYNPTHRIEYQDDTTHRALLPDSTTLDAIAAPVADVSLASHKITNLTDPTAAQDAATKAYADALWTQRDWKDSVRIATTANDTLSGLAARDGVTPVAGDRVLVKNQTTGSQNGIYTVAAGAWGRAADADASSEVTSGMNVPVEEGTVNGGTVWFLTTANPITLGTTALTFAQVPSGTSYTAGTGISISGSVISVATTYRMQKYSTTITGDGATTSFNIDHNLGVSNLAAVRVKAVADGSLWEVDEVESTTNRLVISFAVAPLTGVQYQVTVAG